MCRAQSNELRPNVDKSVGAADVGARATTSDTASRTVEVRAYGANRLCGPAPQTCRVGPLTDTCFGAAHTQGARSGGGADLLQPT